MSANCGVCDTKCTEDKSTKCAACDSIFHTSCVKNEGLKTRSGWKCDECTRKYPPSGSSNKSSASTTTMSKEFMINVLDSFKKEVFEELKNYSKQMAEFNKTVEFLSLSIDTSNALMKEVRKEYAEIKKENQLLREENKKLNDSVSSLHDRVRELEQYSRRTNLEISGVPTTPREDTLSLLRDIGSAIGQELLDDQITAAHRVPSFNRMRSPPLIVQFQNRAQRDSWLNSYKKKGTLKAREINSRFDESRVYINEHLSPDNKKFLNQLKSQCKEKGVKFVWFRDGKFYARKCEGDRCYKINKLEDLTVFN